MSQPLSGSPNPYQSPQAVSGSIATPSGANLRLVKVLKDFRSQSLALGVVWILLSGLALGAGALLGRGLPADDAGSQIILILFGVFGLIWGDLGICTCLKQMWAVYAGLVLSYISVMGSLLSVNVCSLVLLAVIIIQAHRMIGFARELTRAGIPLTMRPQDLEIKLQMQAAGPFNG
jgi:hypothetical protein